MLEHAILVNAGFVGKGVGTDNGLVRLYRETGDAGYHARGTEDLGGIDAGMHVEQIFTGLDRHDDLFQRGITGALTQPVDGAFHLARTGHHRGQRVGYRQTQVVMTVHGKNGLVRVGHTLDQLADQLGILVRDVIAYGIGNIDGAGTGVNRCLNDTAKEVQLAAASIFTGKLDIVTQAAGLFHRTYRLLHHLVRLHTQLVFHMDRAGGDKGMDTTGVGPGQRLAGTLDIGIQRTGKAADGTVLDGVGNGLDRIEVTRAGNGKTGLDHINLHALQCLGNTQFFILGHGCAGALLTVTQGGIKNDDAVVATHRNSPRSGRISLL